MDERSYVYFYRNESGALMGRTHAFEHPDWTEIPKGEYDRAKKRADNDAADRRGARRDEADARRAAVAAKLGITTDELDAVRH